jgi:hypothetical protein
MEEDEERAGFQAQIDLYMSLGAGYTEAYVRVIMDRLTEVGVPEEGRDFTITDDGDLIVTAPGYRVVFHNVIHPDLQELDQLDQENEWP